jgi:hypothetical protein
VKIEEVINKYKKTHGTVTERVFSYLKAHPDEVFRYDDKAFNEDLQDDKIESINYALWRLEKDKRIDKLKIAPKVTFFGCHEAIERLRDRLTGLRSKTELEENGRVKGLLDSLEP